MGVASPNLGLQNWFSDSLAASCGSGDTTLSLNNLPTPTEGFLVIDPANTSTREVIHYTGKSGSTLTGVTRGVDGTTARAHNQGVTVSLEFTSSYWNALQDGSAITYSLSQGWQNLGATVTYGTNNGNKEFTVTSGTDLTGTLSPGMRFNITRGTTPPTQCMSFTAASSQYATKASPAGITFTSNFTIEAWVYLNSYTGGNQCIIGRDSTGGSGSGWELDIQSSGQLLFYWRNASGATNFQTYQSVPLNRWVHIAAVATVSTPTAAFYINGALVPGFSAATAATSVVQASANLTMGNRNSASGYLNGYISEARIWATAQTQANIQANMAISLTGSETNLVALFQGNGNFNDSTSNANNLTATNGAIATQASNPYSATEYAIITKVSYSNPTTTLTLFTGTDYTIPNQTLNSPYYSTVKAPYGWPVDSNKWIVDAMNKTLASQTSISSSTWYNVGSLQLAVPTGAWDATTKGGVQVNGAGSGDTGVKSTLSTANNTESDSTFTAVGIETTPVTIAGGNIFSTNPLRTTSMTTYYFNSNVYAATGGVGSATLYNRGDVSPTTIRVKSAYA